jgi:hypothetical protein
MEHECRCQPNIHLVPSNRSSVDFAVNHRLMHTQDSGRSRKRQPSEDLSLCENHRQKKQKLNHPSGSQTPGAFWDNLSKIWLTRNALRRELDRRSSQASPAGTSATFETCHSRGARSVDSGGV